MDSLASIALVQAFLPLFSRDCALATQPRALARFPRVDARGAGARRSTQFLHLRLPSRAPRPRPPHPRRRDRLARAPPPPSRRAACRCRRAARSARRGSRPGRSLERGCSLTSTSPPSSRRAVIERPTAHLPIEPRPRPSRSSSSRRPPPASKRPRRSSSHAERIGPRSRRSLRRLRRSQGPARLTPHARVERRPFARHHRRRVARTTRDRRWIDWRWIKSRLRLPHDVTRAARVVRALEDGARRSSPIGDQRASIARPTRATWRDCARACAGAMTRASLSLGTFFARESERERDV